VGNAHSISIDLTVNWRQQVYGYLWNELVVALEDSRDIAVGVDNLGDLKLIRTCCT